MSTSKMDAIMDELAARFILTCPTEEFKSFERLFFQIEAAHWFYIDHFVEHDQSLPALKLKDFTRLLFKHCPMLASFEHDIENHVKSFSEYKVGVPVYGAILVNENLDKCLLVKGWHKNSTWGFPKGKINQNEAESACAVREVWEEIGYDCGHLLNESDHLKVTLNSHEMKLYIIAGVPESTHFVTQTKQEISRIEWFPIKDLPSSKTAGSSNFFLVSPFVRQLQQWITSRQMGRAWSPSTRTKTPSKLAKSASMELTPKKASRTAGTATPSKGSADVPAPGTPHHKENTPKKNKQQQQQQQQHPSVSATADGCAAKQPVRILKRGDPAAASEPREEPMTDRPGNPVFGRGFSFNTAEIMAPLRALVG